jgi:hypothetical protein
LKEFYTHAASHNNESYKAGCHRCIFGCKLGFVDAVAEWFHYLEDCQATQIKNFPLPKGSHYTICRAPYGSPPSWKGSSKHQNIKHAVDLYADLQTPYKRHYCAFGFEILVEFAHHVRGNKTAGPGAGYYHTHKVQMNWVLMDTADGTHLTRVSGVYIAAGYAKNMAGSARLSSVLTTYDASLYSETEQAFIAFINLMKIILPFHALEMQWTGHPQRV